MIRFRPVRKKRRLGIAMNSRHLCPPGPPYLNVGCLGGECVRAKATFFFATPHYPQSLHNIEIKEGGEGNKIVAMAFVDVSAGFDSVPHTQLLRKLEGIGYSTGALKWISDYLTGRSQYVVVEAEDGRRFGMPVGTPQGGALGPILWREYTNDLPECVKGKPQGTGREEEN